MSRSCYLRQTWYVGPVKSHCSQGVSHTLLAEVSKSSGLEGGHRTGQSFSSIHFHNSLIDSQIYPLVKCFLFLISLCYLFVLTHRLGEASTPLSLIPNRENLPLFLETDGSLLLLLLVVL